ncbi:MAG: hypothetical protein M0Z49_07055 [Chloroflexi bacterium]|nr:hypothetical protein [Chloroflexota bacterium]
MAARTCRADLRPVRCRERADPAEHGLELAAAAQVRDLDDAGPTIEYGDHAWRAYRYSFRITVPSRS